MNKRWVFAMLFLCLVGMGAGAAVLGEYKGFPTVQLVINGRQVVSDVPPLVVDGRTMLPVRAVADAFGLEVNWDANSRTVTLSGTQSSTSPTQSGPGYVTISTQDEYNALATQTPEQLSRYQQIIWIFPGSIAITDPVTFLAFAQKKLTVDEFFQKSKSVAVPAPSAPPSATSSSRVTIPSGHSGQIQVVGSDQQFLGYLMSSEYDSDSICNKYGTHGSEYSMTSVFNPYGQYGSSYSSKSAFSDYASDPPMLVENGKVIGYLTTNQYKQGAISPIGICQSLKEIGL